MTEKGDPVDPLDALVANTRTISRDLLASVLKDKVWLDTAEKRVQLVPEMRTQMDARQVVLLALLGQKALSMKVEEVGDALSPKEVEDLTGLKGGTIRPLVKRLVEQGLIVRRPEGYAVHNAAFHLVAGAINRKE